MIQFVRRPALRTITPARTCRARLIDQLESTMREMAFAGENITPETLMQHGFNAAVIARYGEAAVSMARRRSIRRVDHVEA